jgi:hypothetical protein
MGMNRTLMQRVIVRLMASAGVAVLCAVVALAQDAGAAAQSQGQPSGQQGQRTDGQIEMDVVHALDASQALKNDLITAATIQGEVTLSGTVSSEASKQLAESIVSHVNGVTKVHNNLKVGNPSQEAQAAQPAPENQEMPDADQSQAQQGMANLPPPGPPPPGEYPQNQGQAPSAAPNQQQSPYPQQGGYPPPPPQRPQYQNPNYSQYPRYAPPPSAPAYETPRGPVTIPQGTLLQLRTSEPVDSKNAKDGTPVQFMVIQDVAVGGVLAIPRGAVVHGVVTEVKKVGSGDLGGSSTLALTLTSLDLGGYSYQLSTDQFKVKGPNKAGQTVSNAVGAGIIGTIIGCAVGRGAGCAIGAGAGVAAGTAASAASPGPRAWIPPEALVTFHLNAPLTVTPVSAQEAARLAEGLYPGGPSLYRRGPYGPRYYGYAGYAYPYGYPYPPVYYRPYYLVGGAYYWR